MNFWQRRRREYLQRAALEAEGNGDLPKAVAARRGLARLEPRSAAAMLELARALQRAAEFRPALQAYEEALALGVSGIDAHLQLAWLLLRQSEPERAIGHLRQALALEPSNTGLMCMLGTVLRNSGRRDAALEICGRASALEPANQGAHYHLGLARFESGDLRGAAESFARCFALIRGESWTPDPAGILARTATPEFDSQEMAVNRVKIAHDYEQLEYLLGIGRLPAVFRDVAADYRALLAEDGNSTETVKRAFDQARHPLVARTYKRPFHVDSGAVPACALLNPALDWKAAEARYLAATPSTVTIDDFLTPEALDAVRRFCSESTIWNEIKPGYLGAYLNDGFAPEVLLRLAADLRERLPRIVRGLPLQGMWGYKYDSALPRAGIGWHADEAAVNVNFWITADEANLDPDHGGMLIYPVRAPREWDFAEYNVNPVAILEYLETTGSAPIRIPYRANRAVIFDSDLFHATDGPMFRDSYLCRRVNVTMLYGPRGA